MLLRINLPRFKRLCYTRALCVIAVCAYLLSASVFAATITQSFNAPAANVDGQPGGGNVFVNSFANVPAAAYPAGSTINDVTATVVFDKIDGGTGGQEANLCPNHVGGSVYNAETFIQLRSPTGVNRTLVNFGTYTGNGHPGFVTVTFDDAAGGGAGPGTPVSGTFTPNQALNAFDGINPVGNWRFRIGDSFAQDPLCVQSFAVRIVADVPDPEVEFTVTTSSAGENAGTVNIEVSLEYAIDQDITVPYTFNASSTATGGGIDYTDSTSGSVVITAGNTTANVQLAINDDILFEANETVVIELTAPAVDAVLGANTQHVLTINDNDTIADISIRKSDFSASYTPGGTATYTIQVVNDGPSSVNGVSVVDNLPAGVSNNGNWSCTPSGGASCISGSAPGTTASGSGNINQLVDIPLNGIVEFSLPVSFSANMSDY